MKKINHNAKNMMRVDDAKAELDKAYSMEQKRYIEEKISNIERAHVKPRARLVWATVNEVTGRKKSNEGRLKANSPEERLKLWKNHFEQLLGQPTVLDDQPIEKVFYTPYLLKLGILRLTTSRNQSIHRKTTKHPE